jgi:xanthine dehydrogenase accessory factor
MDTSILERLLDATERKRSVVLATRLRDGRQALLFEHTSESGIEALGRGGGEVDADEWPIDAARRALAEDRTLLHDEGGDEILLRPYNPPVRLFVIGAVHVAQPLVTIAAAAGLDVRIVDPRTAFATEDRFPGVRLARDRPFDLLRDAALDHRSAVVALTHDAKIDDPALIAALESTAFYIGALGSRTTHEKRLQRLRERGVPDEALRRIRAPIGLDIGARTPGEIAVAIVAELVQQLRRADSSEGARP